MKRAAWIACELLCLALAFAPPAHAQWKWKDASGSVVLSDRPPPPDVPQKNILQRPGSRPVNNVDDEADKSEKAASAAAPGRVDPELQARRKRLKAKEEAEQAEANKAIEQKNAAARADNCRRAQQQMQALQSGARVARINDKGEREISDDRAREDDMRHLREVMASDCR